VIAYHFVVDGTLDERRWERMRERRDALGEIHGNDDMLPQAFDEFRHNPQ
jgi:hypothetical protein